ncbi:MAG: hypothetical protein K9J06_13465 [Flavobacteriales bacterium]|nr:hypothetical protein [Flavobacteriales bacterium]
MSADRQDEIMQEVVKLQQLIAECCPEVMFQYKEIPDSIDLKEETDALNRHRLNIISEATGRKKSA